MTLRLFLIDSVNRLGNIVTNENRKNITKELYKIEKNKNLSDREKKRNIWLSCQFNK